MKSCRAALFAAGLVGAITLAGCQQPGSSTSGAGVEPAKSLPADFTNVSVSVPPRSVDDVLVLLDTAPDSADVAKRRAKANEAPPAGASDGELANFYFDRGEAAYDVGYTSQAVKDYNAALPLAISAYGHRGAFWDKSVRRTFYFGAAWSEYSYGDPVRGLALLKELANYAENDHDRMIISGNWTIALALSGRIREAEQELVNFNELASTDPYPSAWSRYKQEEVPAYLATAKGERAEAEKHLRNILGLRGTLEHDTSVYYFARSSLADALLAGGDPIAAEIEARLAVREAVADTGKGSTATTYAVMTLANAVAAEGRPRDAEKLLQRAIAMLQASGVPASAEQMLIARIYLAEAYAALSQWGKAAELYLQLVQDRPAGGISTFDAKFDSSSYPLALIKTGKLDDAVKVADERFQRVSQNAGPNTYPAAEAAIYKAIAVGEKGDTAQAIELFRRNFPILASRSHMIAQSGVAQAAAARRLEQFVSYYLKYLSQSGGAANADEAFQAADLARGHAVDSALNQAAARTAPQNPELRDLARQEQDALNQIAALSSLLAGRGGDAANDADLRKRIDTLRDARAKLIEAIEARFPSYAALINPKPPSVGEVQAQLRSGEALIAMFVGDDQSYVWAIPKSGAPAFASVAIGSQELAAQVQVLRHALSPNAATLGDIPAFDLSTAHSLYAEYLEPVKSGWSGSTVLIVAAHRDLTQIPFGVLTTEQTQIDINAAPLFSGYAKAPWLARKFAIATVPTASSFVVLRQFPPPAAGRQPLAAFADPIFVSQAEPVQVASAGAAPSTTAATRDLTVRGMPLKVRSAPDTTGSGSAQLASLPPLPDTADEAKGIAVSMHADAATALYLGPRATEQQVETMNLSDRRVVVFATHGLVPGDLDGLYEPALALSSPGATKSSGDGLLTAGEILNLKLDADWVVLSACNTSAGSGEGSEAISGLGRAFFYAGARALLVSNWPVETTSARMLTTGIFERQSGQASLGKAVALQQTELALITGPGYQDGGKELFSYAHPIFWAPFTLVGDPN